MTRSGLFELSTRTIDANIGLEHPTAVTEHGCVSVGSTASFDFYRISPRRPYPLAETRYMNNMLRERQQKTFDEIS